MVEPLNRDEEIRRINNLGDDAPYSKVFGMSGTSSKVNVNKKYKELSLLIHPDKNSDNVISATRAFQKLTSAFEQWKSHFESQPPQAARYSSTTAENTRPSEPKTTEPRPSPPTRPSAPPPPRPQRAPEPSTFRSTKVPKMPEARHYPPPPERKNSPGTMPDPGTFKSTNVPPIPKSPDEFAGFDEFDEIFKNFQDEAFDAFFPRTGTTKEPAKFQSSHQSSGEELDRLAQSGLSSNSSACATPQETNPMSREEFAAQMRKKRAKERAETTQASPTKQAATPVSEEGFAAQMGKKSAVPRAEKNEPSSTQTSSKKAVFTISTYNDVLRSMDKVIADYRRNGREVAQKFGINKYEELKRNRDAFMQNKDPVSLKKFLTTAGIAREGWFKASHGSTRSIEIFYKSISNPETKKHVHEALGLKKTQLNFKDLKKKLKNLIEPSKHSDDSDSEGESNHP